MGYGIRLRLRLLKINAINTWQTETAYLGDTWGNLLSTITFTVTMVLLVQIIYANVDTLAGYTRDQMLLLFLVNQISFYLVYTWSYSNIKQMVESVNSGSFDLILVKPLPTLFYTSLRSISLLSVLRDGLPPILLIALAINWSNISITLPLFLAGLAVMIAGQLALNGFLFLLGVPVFRLGESSAILDLAHPFMSSNLPFEGVTGIARVSLTVLIPALLPAALATSVMLGKSNAITGLIFAWVMAMVFMLIKIRAWRWALHQYTSASS